MKKFFKRIKNYWNKSGIIKRLLILLILVSFLVLIGNTLGRYIYLEIRDFYLASQDFYFSSDKLEPSIKRYQIDNWSGVEEYYITVNMNSYKNNNKYSNIDIYYDISYRCSTNIICDVDKTNSAIDSERHIDSFLVTIVPNASFNDGDEAWVEVYAESTEPYVKELSGRFVLKVGKIGTAYQILDKPNQPYFDLNVTNTLDYYVVNEAFGDYTVNQRIDISTYSALSDANKAKCSSVIVTLNFDPDDVRLDMTNQNYLDAIDVENDTYGGYTYITGFSFKVDALSSSVVRFYKVDTSSDYSFSFGEGQSIVDVAFE